jgi:uncharacterized membrane protein
MGLLFSFSFLNYLLGWMDGWVERKCLADGATDTIDMYVCTGGGIACAACFPGVSSSFTFRL